MTDATTAAAPSFEALLERPGLAWMGQNTTHLEPPPEVIEALTESTRRREFQLYAPALGLSELRSEILADLGLPAMTALITDGAVGGLHHLCTTFAADISGLVTTDPGWPWPGRFVARSGVPVTAVGVYEGGKLTAEQLAAAIIPNAMVYLIDPLNPLGSCYTRAELVELVEVARAADAIIVHDCTYRHFADRHALVAELYPERTLTTYSFSKWLGLAGLRLGAVVAPAPLAGQLSAVPANPLGANIQAQRAAIAGLKVKGPWLRLLTETNRRNQRVVADAVAASGLGEILVEPSQGNFLAVDIAGSGWNSDGLCAALLTHDVFIRSGTYQSPRYGERFVKISTSVPPDWADRFAQAWTQTAGEGPR